MVENQKLRAITAAEDKIGLKRDLASELDHLEAELTELRLEYEQYFAGVIPLAPEKMHARIKHTMRRLRKAPFRNSALNYRLRAIEQRYQTFNNYWQRVLKQRDEGKYFKDVFKANLRERLAEQDARAQSDVGRAEHSMRALFEAYRAALEKQTGRPKELSFDAFQKSLVTRAKDFKQKHPDKKLAFKVVVKDGKVMMQARVRN